MFKIGDRIRSRSSGYTARIIGVNSVYDPQFQGTVSEYTAKWDNFVGIYHNGGVGTYKHFDVVNEWELMPVQPVDADSDYIDALKYSINEVMRVEPEQLQQMKKLGCEHGHHSWKTYNSGWTIFDYCEHCSIEREKV